LTTLWLSLVLFALVAAPAHAQDSTSVQASASSDSSFGFQEFTDSEPTSEPEPVENAVSYAPYFHYNRVDQWAIGVQMGYAPNAGWYPCFRVRVAETFNRDHRGFRRRLLLCNFPARVQSRTIRIGHAKVLRRKAATRAGFKEGRHTR
jgi:hypothetical protein